MTSSEMNSKGMARSGMHGIAMELRRSARIRKARAKTNYPPITGEKEEHMGMVSRLAKKKARQEAKAEADRLVLEANYELCRKMDLLWLYVLHEVCGFGKVRLLRVYWKMIEIYIQVMRRFRYENDDSHWYAMEKHLREDVGVDVRALQEEADRRYPDGADGAREE